jgi:hypothetical protein
MLLSLGTDLRIDFYLHNCSSSSKHDPQCKLKLNKSEGRISFDQQWFMQLADVIDQVNYPSMITFWD